MLHCTIVLLIYNINDAVYASQYLSVIFCMGTNLYTQIIGDASAAGQLVMFVSEICICYKVILSVFVINLLATKVLMLRFKF